MERLLEGNISVFFEWILNFFVSKKIQIPANSHSCGLGFDNIVDKTF